MTPQTKGYIAATIAPFFIALSIILTKEAGLGASPLIISGLGMLISLPFVMLLQILSKSPLALRTLLTETRVPFLKVLFSRAIIGSYLIVTGFTMTTAVKSVLLLRLEPLFVFLWSMILYKEKPQARKLMLLFLLLLGSAMVVFTPRGSTSGPNLGDAMVVASLLFLSYSYGPTKDIVTKASPIALNLMCNLIGGIALLAMGLWVNPQALALSQKTIWTIVGYAVVFYVLATTFYFEAFRTLKPWVVACFLSLEVVFGLTLAFILLHETISPFQFAGAVTVLSVTVFIAKTSMDSSRLAQSEPV